MGYNRQKAVAYAHEWAFGRNPVYFDFSGIGGDCTNFISQCLHAGGARMDFTPDTGWYYRSAGDRAAAWSSARYLYAFLTENTGEGPFATETAPERLLPGDVVQMAFARGVYTHSLLVVQTQGTADTIRIAAHSDDSDYRPLSSYWPVERRYLMIDAR